MLNKLTDIVPGMGGSDGRLVKAQLVLCDMVKNANGQEPTINPKTSLEVQFNPSEYTITRTLQMDKSKGNTQESGDGKEQVVASMSAVLNVTLYFDAFTNLNRIGLMNAPQALMGAVADPMGALKEVGQSVLPAAFPEVNDRCMQIATLLRFVPEKHQPPVVGFVWGEAMSFFGKVERSTITYTMFAPNGMPVRMKVALSISGEQSEIKTDGKSKPGESPDRTKERFLHYGDQIWMMAQDEFGDPAMWKEIARSNGILNPRAVDRGMLLKVPSTR